MKIIKMMLIDLLELIVKSIAGLIGIILSIIVVSYVFTGFGLLFIFASILEGNYGLALTMFGFDMILLIIFLYQRTKDKININ